MRARKTLPKVVRFVSSCFEGVYGVHYCYLAGYLGLTRSGALQLFGVLYTAICNYHTSILRDLISRERKCKRAREVRRKLEAEGMESEVRTVDVTSGRWLKITFFGVFLNESPLNTCDGYEKPQCLRKPLACGTIWPWSKDKETKGKTSFWIP